MPIQLIAETERHSVTIAGTRIDYRRIPPFIQKQLEHKNTRRGVVDHRALVDAALEYAVLGWQDMQDAEGNAVPFQTELLKYLPEEARAQIVERLYESDPVETALKNLSAGTPAS
jgi:hypothetical protein